MLLVLWIIAVLLFIAVILLIFIAWSVGEACRLIDQLRNELQGCAAGVVRLLRGRNDL